MIPNILRTSKMNVSLEDLWAAAGALATTLWGMLTWRIGKGEKNTDRLFKMLDEHMQADVENHNTVIKELHEMHINLLEKINSRAP